ncbi:MAG: putative DNA binding domain-containing protein [Firmicutes bacterium]|nr:putative DNA binding domain-containing protein [Bacillota bacterium]
MQIQRINIDELIHARGVETTRLEFKAVFSEQNESKIIQTICAFANDFHNLNGGYIIIGIEEKDGLPVLPPVGVESADLEIIQKKIHGKCNQIEPEYYPLISSEEYMGKFIIIIFAPGGEFRPYAAPLKSGEKIKQYYIRHENESVPAQGNIRTELIQMTNRIPFDDQRFRDANIALDVLNPLLIRNYLSDIGSKAVRSENTITDTELMKNLDLGKKINSHHVPKNFALLFFTEDPETYFRGVRTEIVQFSSFDEIFEETVIRGPLHSQIRETLTYLENMNTISIKKNPERAETEKYAVFPYQAMEEAVVNAFYHRSYDNSPEPVKIYLYPDKMEIISYPGPVPGLKPEHFTHGNRVPPVPNRNRRIGEILSQLKLAEGRLTGIPTIFRKMMENGSPEPVFDFDDERTYFRVTLPAHPQYIIRHTTRDCVSMWLEGRKTQALKTLHSTFRKYSGSGLIAAQIIEYTAEEEGLIQAEDFYKKHSDSLPSQEKARVMKVMSDVFLNYGEKEKAAAILRKIPSLNNNTRESLDIALSYKRAGAFSEAHAQFCRNGDLINNDPKALHEFAQTKIKLASELFAESKKSKYGMEKRNELMLSNKKLLHEALDILRRVADLSPDDIRRAWCWYDIAQTLFYLRYPRSETAAAISKAIELMPNESVFANWQARNLKQRKN